MNKVIQMWPETICMWCGLSDYEWTMFGPFSFCMGCRAAFCHTHCDPEGHECAGMFVVERPYRGDSKVFKAWAAAQIEGTSLEEQLRDSIQASGGGGARNSTREEQPDSSSRVGRPIIPEDPDDLGLWQ